MSADTDTTIRPQFEVTSAAIGQIVALGGAVRIDLERGGCCGTAYAFHQIDEGGWHERDVVYGCPGAWLAVSPDADAVLAGASVDWNGQLKPPRFRVLSNPNTPHICPCKRSFGRPWPGPKQPECRSYLPMPWDDTYDPPRAWKRQTGRLE